MSVLYVRFSEGETTEEVFFHTGTSGGHRARERRMERGKGGADPFSRTARRRGQQESEGISPAQSGGEKRRRDRVNF